MARYFAELNSDNKVIRVIVVADDITGSLQSTESETYVESNFSHNEGGVSEIYTLEIIVNIFQIMMFLLHNKLLHHGH